MRLLKILSKITKYEYAMLCLFFLGLWINSQFIHMRASTLMIFFTFGLVFEIITDNMWKYNDSLSDSPFTFRTRDINMFVGFGWSGLILLSIAGARLISFAVPVTIFAYMISTSVIGLLVMKYSLMIGLYKINFESWFFRSCKKKDSSKAHLRVIFGLIIISVIAYSIYYVSDLRLTDALYFQGFDIIENTAIYLRGLRGEKYFWVYFGSFLAVFPFIIAFKGFKRVFFIPVLYTTGFMTVLACIMEHYCITSGGWAYLYCLACYFSY